MYVCVKGQNCIIIKLINKNACLILTRSFRCKYRLSLSLENFFPQSKIILYNMLKKIYVIVIVDYHKVNIIYIVKYKRCRILNSDIVTW